MALHEAVERHHNDVDSSCLLLQPYLFELSKKTFGKVKQNIFSSIVVKGSFAVLAFPGIVTLWMAVAYGDMGLSLLVLLNALRFSMLMP